MKSIGRLLLGLGLFALPSLLQAQATSSGTDSIVQLTAEAQGLSPVSPENLPPVGTFWVVTPDSTGGLAPWPCAPSDRTLPIYAITGDAFLVDATAGQVSTTDAEGETISTETALTNLASAVVGVIQQVQDSQTTSTLSSSSTMMAMDSIDPTDPGSGDTNGYGSYTNSFVPFPLDTNTLWLEVTNVDVFGGIAYANLHMATNLVYAIKTATNLVGSWQVEDEVWPTDTNCQPFTMQTLGRDILFLRAEDWTGVDSDGDGVPDWWAWLYWGTNNVADTNLDYSGSGNTFAEDYSNNITPTVFSFTGIQVASNVVSSTTLPMQLDVTGYPYYMAMVMDDTNYVAAANWQLYTGSNITVSLGLTEGWHDVWIGLLGHGSDPTNAVWQWQRMKLDYTAPSLVITGPTNDTVTVPLVQITGYSPEALASINYDISNALETVTNQLAMITGQTYSTNSFEFTTNYFQCYDVPLASGLNTITIHATDSAGNVTTLATNITYSATTNPPVVGLIWPQSGMQISSGSITIQGHVDDPTANVVVSSVDADGHTNSFSGLTGRDGVFWVENVPLSSGTNHLAITVSNAVGETTTNATLIQSAVGLTVNSVQAGDAMITGTIGASGYTIWVNGNQATNNGDRTWTAQISPLCVGGGQVAVAAIPDSDNGGNGSSGGDGLNPSSSQSINTQATVQTPEGVFIASYYKHERVVNPPVFPGGPDSHTGDSTMKWQDGQEGHFYELVDTYYSPDGFHDSYSIDWPTNEWPQALPQGETTHVSWGDNGGVMFTNTYVDNQPYMPWEHCDIAWRNDFNSGRRTADAEIQLATGGPLGSKQMNLWCLTASATGYTNDAEGNPIGFGIPAEQINIGGLGNLDTNGELWVILPDNDPDVVTPHVAGKNKDTFTVAATEYHPYISLNGENLDFNNTPTNCVGQQMKFSIGWRPYTPDKIADMVVHWTLPGTFVNTNSDPNCDLYYSKDASQLVRIQSRDGTTATSCWYVKALQNETVSATMNVTMANGKQYVLQTSGKFNVFRPTTAKATPYQPEGIPTAQILGNTLSLGVSGVTNDMSFSHTINPGDFAGQACYVQLVGGVYTLSSTGLPIPVAPDDGAGTPDTELDNNAPTRGPFSVSGNTNNTVVFQDAPADGLFQGNAKEDLEFSNYLMFKPAGGIWVPLRLITWELHDESLNLTVQGGATITGDGNCTTFPDWSNTFKNYGM